MTVDGAGTVVVDDVSELVTGDEEVDSASTARVELSIVSSLKTENLQEYQEQLHH